MAYMIIAYMVMAHTAMAYSYGLYIYGLYSDGAVECPVGMRSARGQPFEYHAN